VIILATGVNAQNKHPLNPKFADPEKLTLAPAEVYRFSKFQKFQKISKFS
jgi:hypothetical protein